MQVRNWMAKDVVTVRGATRIGEAFALMQAHKIRHLPVVEEDRLIGIVTDRDLRPALTPSREVAGRSRVLESVPVSAIMTKRVVGVSPDVSIGKAADLMVRNKIGCLPVLDGDALVGIITDSDILRAVVAEKQGCAC